MLKKTSILLSLIFAGSLLVGLVDKADKSMITAKEVHKLNNLRTKIVQSNAVKAKKSLSIAPKQLEKSLLDIKLSSKVLSKADNKIRGLNEHQLNSNGENAHKYGADNRDCSDCEFDFTAYGSECCDSAWDEYGIDCATLEANYTWDCSGCVCPGDVACEDQGLITCEYGAVGGGNCAEDESGCLEAGECPAGQVSDCDGSGECWPESWVADGFCDGEDQQYGADLLCYDNDGGDCEPEDCCGVPGGDNSTCGGSGDVDGGGVSVTDIVAIIGDILLTAELDECAANEADLTGDGEINVMDVIAAVDIILAGNEDGGDDGDSGDDGGAAECEEGTVADCSGDGDCCPDSWIADGFADCEDQAYGCDLTCYDNDGGDCATEGRASSDGFKSIALTSTYSTPRSLSACKERSPGLILRLGLIVL